MMLSPVHLFLIVSNDYFGASLRKAYVHLLMPLFCVLLYAVVAYNVLHLLKW